MTTFYKRANILCLPGLCENDLIIDDDDLITATFDDTSFGLYQLGDMETMLDNDIEPEIFEIPVEFTGFDTWIKQTPALCWQCDCRIQSMPLFMPDTINNIAPISMDVHGQFCSFPCVQAYINEKYIGQNRSTKSRMLRILAKLYYNKTIDVIPTPPAKTIMRKYCGSGGLTEEEYMKKIEDIELL